MRSWIFQANPRVFDVDRFLANGLRPFTWLVTKYATDIDVGDRVYIWRASAGEKEKAGVIAEAIVVSPVSRIASDEQGAAFWSDTEQAQTEADRVWLQLIRRGSAKETLRREWLLKDAELQNMLILRQAAGTNFPLTEPEANRLAKMWARVGQDWSRNESLAGLWAYVATLDRDVSTKPGSPVEVVSRLTGRAIPGVYNKVMNFRSLDPRDERTGMTGAGKADRTVWAEYFDAEQQELRSAEIVEEFRRLWREAVPGRDAKPDAEALDASSAREAERLGARPLSDLMVAYAEQRTTGHWPSKPNIRLASSTVYERNPLVIALAKLRSKGQCEVPECSHPPFLTKDGNPYIEVHHLTPLSEGGHDTIENVVCVCANHHRECHYGQNAAMLLDQLRRIRETPPNADAP
ncbi:EVE domain-containing protein [Cupriavidus respiraculi]|uniref:EVE domain-containing protein n=1 Tax=Cupriavidus respiraculi TaxID=195930 RepID=UPI001C952C2A|nr:EVE domain-containing protein [Cupriavidus respiraculi]MBY4945230.1 EVE domain-containing protein [Cupriavidus respiraculi]